MICNQKIQEILRNKGIIWENLINNSQLLEKTVLFAYKAIPIPMRWFVGKKRVRELILSQVKEQKK